MTLSHPAVPTQAEAQKALESCPFFGADPDRDFAKYVEKNWKTIRAALAHFAAESQKVDPVGWQFYKHGFNRWSFPFDTEFEARSCAGQSGFEPITVRPLYTRPGGLTLELARALVNTSRELDLIKEKSIEAAPSYDCKQFHITEEHTAAIKMAEEMVKDIRDAD